MTLRPEHAKLYTFQMNDGRWHISAYTSAPRSAHKLAFNAPGFDTLAEAEAARQDMAERWAADETRRSALIGQTVTYRVYATGQGLVAFREGRAIRWVGESDLEVMTRNGWPVVIHSSTIA